MIDANKVSNASYASGSANHSNNANHSISANHIAMPLCRCKDKMNVLC